MRRLHDDHVKETSDGNTPIHPIQRSRQRRNQQFEGDLKNMIIKSILKQDGGLIFRSHRETSGIQHLRLRQLIGNSTTIGSRTKVGILGDPHLGLNNSDFLSSEMLFFACREVHCLAIDGRCRQIHLPHATFPHVQSLHRSHSTDDVCAWLKIELRSPK